MISIPNQMILARNIRRNLTIPFFVCHTCPVNVCTLTWIPVKDAVMLPNKPALGVTVKSIQISSLVKNLKSKKIDLRSLNRSIFLSILVLKNLTPLGKVFKNS